MRGDEGCCHGRSVRTYVNGEVPLILAGVEDEQIVEEPTIIAASTMHNQIIMQRIHRVPMPSLRPNSLRLDLNPLQQIDLL